MEYVEMQASEMEPDKSYLERLLFPTAELLTNCKMEINRATTLRG